MSNLTIPTVKYAEIPNYNDVKTRGQKILRQSDGSISTSYSVNINNEGLQYDQSLGRAMLAKEREAPMKINDYHTKHFITTIPHENIIKKQLIEGLKWETPENIYNLIMNDIRVLPKIQYIERMISGYYSQIIINNLINIYNNAPQFFNDVINKNLMNFKMYQCFIYLLTFIAIVYEHKDDEEFLHKDTDTGSIRDIIEWCRNRRIQDINYLLQGPLTNQIYNVDFIEIYNSLISLTKSISEINEYLQLATLQEINLNILKFDDNLKFRPNVFEKMTNDALSYTINIDTNLNSSFHFDNQNNLVVNCNDIDLGASVSDPINLDINKTEVNTNLMKQEPKNNAMKFTNLLNKSSKFIIKSLLILKTTYDVNLDIYDNCYVIFPQITMDGQFNQVFQTGTLQIAGKFKENENTKYWEFVPFISSGISYLPTTANVKQFEFYISPRPDKSSIINANNFIIDETIYNYYNISIDVENVADNFNSNEVYLIRLNKINKKGNLDKINYTYLYNRTLKTIQVLQGNYDLTNIPLYNKNRKMKSVKIDVGMMKPIEPLSLMQILNLIDNTFRLPKIVPITNLKVVSDKMAEAILKGQNQIDFDNEIIYTRYKMIDKNQFVNLNNSQTLTYKQ